jgi:choline dehydrogenase-like flavoprotein
LIGADICNASSGVIGDGAVTAVLAFQGAPVGGTLGAIRSSASPRMREHHDIVVIGGGQAGLAMSAVLHEHGREHVVLERRRVGERWRTERWESLRFQFPNWALALPGYSYSGEDPDGFAHWREVLRVIESTRRARMRRCASTPRSRRCVRTSAVSC